MVKSNSSKDWKIYSNGGGVGLGTFSIFCCRYIDSQMAVEFISFLAPTLTFVSANLFDVILSKINSYQLNRYNERLKKHIKDCMNDPDISEAKKKALQKELDKLVDVNIEDLNNKIQRVITPKKQH